jgi:hypothetical protein
MEATVTPSGVISYILIYEHLKFNEENLANFFFLKY